MDFTGRAKWYVPVSRPLRTPPFPLILRRLTESSGFFRDAYNKKKGVDQEEAKTKYADSLKDVSTSLFTPWSFLSYPSLDLVQQPWVGLIQRSTINEKKSKKLTPARAFDMQVLQASDSAKAKQYLEEVSLVSTTCYRK